LGNILPLLVAFFAIPILIHKLGLDQFGLLSLIWVIIGYCSIFDLGIGRATTKFVAEYIALNKFRDLPPLIWTSLFALLSLGLLAGLLVYLVSPLLIHHIFKVSPLLVGEAQKVFIILSMTIPVIFITACLQGVLEAQQLFRLINTINTPANLAYYLVPLLISAYSTSLFHIVAALILVRFAVCIVVAFFCFKSFPGMNRFYGPSFIIIKKLVTFGGWLTITNIISPIMNNLDSLIIGCLLSLQAVAYYVTPYQFITRLWIIPSSVVSVLFPAFTTYATDNHNNFRLLYWLSIKFIFLILAPIVITLIIFARPFLTLWLGPDFSLNSATVFQCLAIGTLITSVAHIPYNAIQAIGRPDLTAKFHLVELPIYLLALWLLVQIFGLIGVAFTWLLRNIIDTCLLFWCAHRLIPERTLFSISINSWLIFKVILLLTGSYFLATTTNIVLKFTFFPTIIIGFFVLGWRYILDDIDKMQIYSIKARFLNFARSNG
jgi:O-antigen/teichoic acid export membrane protein